MLSTLSKFFSYKRSTMQTWQHYFTIFHRRIHSPLPYMAPLDIGKRSLDDIVDSFDFITTQKATKCLLDSGVTDCKNEQLFKKNRKRKLPDPWQRDIFHGEM